MVKGHRLVPPVVVGREGATILYFAVLAVFGLGLALASLWVFCMPSAGDVGACVPQAVNPFPGPP